METNTIHRTRIDYVVPNNARGTARTVDPELPPVKIPEWAHYADINNPKEDENQGQEIKFYDSGENPVGNVTLQRRVETSRLVKSLSLIKTNHG
jgi:hypothetical protein